MKVCLDYGSNGFRILSCSFNFWFRHGFVCGIVGLVLGVVRYPVVMNVEPSSSLNVGTNVGVSTLGAITATIRHYRQGNVQYHRFLVLAATGTASQEGLEITIKFCWPKFIKPTQ